MISSHDPDSPTTVQLLVVDTVSMVSLVEQQEYGFVYTVCRLVKPTEKKYRSPAIVLEQKVVERRRFTKANTSSVSSDQVEGANEIKASHGSLLMTGVIEVRLQHGAGNRSAAKCRAMVRLHMTEGGEGQGGRKGERTSSDSSMLTHGVVDQSSDWYFNT